MEPKSEQRSPRGKARRIGISLMFNEQEHEFLRVVAFKMRQSYSHVIRTLILREMARLVPQGLTDRDREDMKLLFAAQTRQYKGRVHDARKRRASELLEKEAKLRKERLLVQEEVRRIERDKEEQDKRKATPTRRLTAAERRQKAALKLSQERQKSLDFEAHECARAVEEELADLRVHKLASEKAKLQRDAVRVESESPTVSLSALNPNPKISLWYAVRDIEHKECRNLSTEEKEFLLLAITEGRPPVLPPKAALLVASKVPAKVLPPVAGSKARFDLEEKVKNVVKDRERKTRKLLTPAEVADVRALLLAKA